MGRALIRQHPSQLEGLVRASDPLVILLTGYLAYFLRHMGAVPALPAYHVAHLAGALLAMFMLSSLGAYRNITALSLMDQARSVAIAWGAVVATLMGLAFLTQTGTVFSRQWAVIWVVAGFAGMMLNRAVLRRLLASGRIRGVKRIGVGIVGTGALAAEAIAKIEGNPYLGLALRGVYEVPKQEQRDEAIYRRFDVRPADELKAAVEAGEVEQVWFCLPLAMQNQMKAVLDQIRLTTVDVMLVPDFFGFTLLNHSIREIEGLAVMALRESPMQGVNRYVKLAEDLVLSSLILLLVTPVALLIAGMVRLTSRGPIIFKQWRQGFDGRPIKVYKFRTMVLHREPDGVVTQATRNDARVTWFGRLLRRTSLDELPQFFNVLQGRMSIVGPRPHATEHNEQYRALIDQYMLRHKVKPGITGWAQINGFRGETDSLEKMQRRVEYDLYYIENWSLWFDLKIIFLTVFKVWAQRGAY